MLRYLFFGGSADGSTDDGKNEASLLSPKSSQSLIRHLTNEEVVDMFKRIDNNNEDAHAAFLALTDEQQNHIFPLLKQAQRDAIFVSVSSERQAQLVREWEAYTTQASNKDDLVQSFFFLMKQGNHERSRIINCGEGLFMKQSFVVTADRIVDLDIQPYKYQRKLMERHVDCIVDGVTSSLTFFHPIVMAYVQKRNTLTILDGQHRWRALRRVPAEVLPHITLQIDVYSFEDDDEVIMRYYKFINTNVPIDPNVLEVELEYVNLIAELKKKFGESIRHFKKTNEAVPQHFVDDTSLKAELQYREVLKKMKPSAVVSTLAQVNATISNMISSGNVGGIGKDLSLLERRLCDRSNFFLGVDWPYAIDQLEQRMKED